MSRCEVAIERDDADGFVVKCPNEATHMALSWGYGPGSDEIPCCEDHARTAVQDGARVIDDEGDDVLIGDEGELAKVVTIEVCT